MHTQRRYATCPQGMSKKREKRCIPKEGMPHTHKVCQKKENIAHTKKTLQGKRIHIKEFYPPSTKNIHTLAHLDQGL